MTVYAEFRLRIERGTTPGSYRVEASGLGGETPGQFEVPFTETELENFVLKIGRTRRGVRRIESPEMQLAKTFGERLFSAVMQGKVGEVYRAAFSEARAAGQGLRVTLSLTDAPELGGIPWEYMYDPPNFLSISTWTPVVRYLDLPKPRRALEIQLPIRILGVISAPSDFEPLNTQLERTKLEDALKPLIEANAVSIDWLEKPTLLELARKLRDDEFHILHFIGHGGFDDTSGEGALLFEDEAGRGRIVSGDQIATVLHGKVALRLVLLNSCEGARNSVKDPFSGVAASLVQREVPAVIGMQFEITDRAAVLFAGEFYSMLAEGQPVDSAMAEARLAIFADQNDVEWGTPVLFMRVADGRLFSIADATALPRADPQNLPPPTVAPVTDEPVAEPVATPPPTVVVEPPTEIARDATPAPVVAPGLPEGTTPVAGPATVAITTPVPAPSRLSRLSRRTVAISVGLGVAAGIAVLAILAGILSPPASNGTIRVDVGGAWETGIVTVIGTGFAPNEKVDLWLDRVIVDTTDAAPNGSFRAPLAIGSLKEGRIDAVGRQSGNQAGHDFELPPVASQSGGAATLAAGLILFYGDVEPGSQVAADRELYAIDSVTGQIQQVTFNDVDDDYPTWSPDQQRIAFSRGPSGDRDIYILNRDNSEFQLTSGPTDDFFPAWSKGGTIAFVSVAPDNQSSAINTVLPDRTQGTQILTGNIVRAPAWSPDSSAIAFFGDEFADDYDLGMMRPDGSELLRLTVGPTSDRNPSWSPDGRRLAFVMDRQESGDADNDIYLFDSRERTVIARLTDNDVQDGNPVWSPDGTQIAFYRATSNAARPDGYHIWVMNADGSGQRDLMPDRLGRNLDPSWR